MKVLCREENTIKKPNIFTKRCNKGNYVADFCADSYNQFLSWHTYIITCPPGTGKSYMCIRKIIPKAYFQGKKVLLLVNRSKLCDQYKKEITQAIIEGILPYNPCTHSYNNDFDNCLSIMTYQKLEELMNNNYETVLKEMDEYDILIADEVHYFLNDANYNPRLRLSAEVVLIYMLNKTRYLLSATMDNIKPIILNPWKYFIPSFTSDDKFVFTYYSDNKSPVQNVTFIEYIMPENYSYLDVFYFKKRESIIDYIINSEDDEKWLYFISSKSQGEELEKEINALYKESNHNSKKEKIASFISSEYRNDDKTDMKEIMDEITMFEDTKTKVLITTSVLDNGINLKSHKLLNIVIHADNKVSFIQMLGRRRLLTKYDRVKLYIPAEDKELFEKRLKKIDRTLIDINKIGAAEFDQYMTELLYYKDDPRADSFRNVAFPMNECINGYIRSTFIINELSLYQLSLMRRNYQEIIQRFNEIGENAFILEQLKWLGIQYDDSKWLSNNFGEYRRNRINKILSKYVDMELTPDQFDQMKEEIKPIIRAVVPEVRSNRMSIKQANEGLKILKSNYTIDKDTNKVIYMDEPNNVNSQ